MTKQEQIAEMAKVIDKAIQIECLLNNNGHCIDCKFLDKNTDEYQCQSLLVSTVLYNAGYQKAEEVCKETAKEILSDLLDLHNSVQDINQKTDFYCSIEQLIAEIEIKYGIEVEE